MFAKSVVMTGLASIASAHMLMNNPVPYGKSSLNNSPLEADGSDFPCKTRTGVYDAEGASNVYKQGSTQQLSFTGSAVHGGGSCQVSVTTDKEPTKDSVWKVIKSFEGGCPARNTAGNLPENANGEDPDKYNFTIPEDLKAGDYTLAWTWFNKVGNREMYMNCAPLTVEGSGGSDDLFDSLPDMFVANIGNGCTTADSTDLKFPNPGSTVEYPNGNSDALAAPVGTCQAASGGSTGGDGSSSAQPATTTVAPVMPSSSPSGTPVEGGTSAPGGVFITVAPSQPAATSPAMSAAPSASPSASPEAGSGSGSGSGSDSGSSFAAGTACTTEGEWNCIDGSSFQRCASGMWTAVQALSAGVTCSAGQSSDLTMSAKRGRSAMRRALRIRA